MGLGRMQTKEYSSLRKESWIMLDLSWLFINTSFISWKMSDLDDKLCGHLNKRKSREKYFIWGIA